MAVVYIEIKNLASLRRRRSLRLAGKQRNLKVIESLTQIDIMDI
jgi:rRNA processing protein Krr1/Pno1